MWRCVNFSVSKSNRNLCHDPLPYKGLHLITDFSQNSLAYHDFALLAFFCVHDLGQLLLLDLTLKCWQDDENALLQQALAMSMDDPATSLAMRDTDMSEAAADDQDLALGEFAQSLFVVCRGFMVCPASITHPSITGGLSWMPVCAPLWYSLC